MTGVDQSRQRGRPNILITGGNFTNQGAYLMLCEAAFQIREQLNAQPVISLQTGSERLKRWVGLESLLSVPKLKVEVWGGNRSRMRRVKDRLPFVFGSDIDAVFDISGFVFSDEWSHLDLRGRAAGLAKWSDKGVPLYLLPQAFGPFARTSAAAEIVLNSSRLVYAREPESMAFVNSLSGSGLKRCRMAPDFTGRLLSERVDGMVVPMHSVPIVPNWNIVERASSAERERYIANLTASVDRLREHGLLPYGLCHEGGRDLEVLHQVKSRVPDLDIVSGLNGRQSKWLLEQAELVISGRFHALVSSLSRGVPVLMHGWSHKYKWLADDFGVGDLLVDPYALPVVTEEKIDLLVKDRVVRAREISIHADAQLVKTEQMWREIRSDFESVR